jgi:predicted O-methyltransferase YrrM
MNPERLETLLASARAARGFMPDDEGLALYEAALAAGSSPAAKPVVLLEVGSWCGKSATYLGAAAEATGAQLISVDHHHGSEENQEGWDYFERELVDPADGRLNTLPHFQRQIAVAELERSVVGIVGHSTDVAAWWTTPLSFLFIDGGHGEEPAWADWNGWTPHLAVGGTLAIHDVFENPADGGRPPYELFCHAIASGNYQELSATGSLRVLKKLAA